MPGTLVEVNILVATYSMVQQERHYFSPLSFWPSFIHLCSSLVDICSCSSPRRIICLSLALPCLAPVPILTGILQTRTSFCFCLESFTFIIVVSCVSTLVLYYPFHISASISNTTLLSHRYFSLLIVVHPFIMFPLFFLYFLMIMHISYSGSWIPLQLCTPWQDLCFVSILGIFENFIFLLHLLNAFISCGQWWNSPWTVHC